MQNLRRMRVRGLKQIQTRSRSIRLESMAAELKDGGSQMGYMHGEQCLLLDDGDRVVGHDSKLNCHLTEHKVRKTCPSRWNVRKHVKMIYRRSDVACAVFSHPASRVFGVPFQSEK